MATKIEWSDETLNPFFGCTKVSPGCAECYAEKMARRLAAMKQGYYTDVINQGKWNGYLTFNPAVMQKALDWKKPKRIFLNSMSDTFHEKVDMIWLDIVFDVIKRCPQHTFILLTKRPEIALQHAISDELGHYFNLPNIWLGVTVENQEMADMRIPILLNIPAAKRFVSIEPMLGHVIIHKEHIRRLHWVICGGMSGSNDYPVKVEWVALLQRQCKLTNTPFLFKQWGGLNKKRNGRLLGGVLYDEYPEPYDFHVIYTDKDGKVQEDLHTADTVMQVEEWLLSIKAKYWEIGLPSNFR